MKIRMKSLIILLSCAVVSASLYSCSSSEAPKNKKKESLIEISNGVFTEYYPGRKAIKFQGPIDENEDRNGRWFFYDESGKEQSMTEYTNGKKNGFIFVRYPNGNMRYTGEYQMDKEIGLWKFYDENGRVSLEKNYDEVSE